jgi:hypothetical protein
VTCPDGTTIRRAVCSGREGCDPGSCPAGQACYSFEDPFDEDFYCITADFCGAAPATEEALLAWEIESRQRSDALRTQFKERMDRRTGKASAPAAGLEPKPPPPVPVAAVAPSATRGSVLVEAWGSDLALVACVDGDTVATGGDCAPQLPPGSELVHAAWRLRIRGPKALDCAPTSEQVPGLGAEQLGTAPGEGERWGWVPTAPPGWRAAGLSPLDPVLATVVRREMGSAGDGAQLELAVMADLDGDAYEERVVRAFYPSDDPEKAGHSALWLVDDAAVGPLPTEGMEINGVADLRGIVPLAGGGALIVFTTDWTEGSGVHVVGPRAGALLPLAEVACGS